MIGHSTLVNGGVLNLLHEKSRQPAKPYGYTLIFLWHLPFKVKSSSVLLTALIGTFSFQKIDGGKFD